MDSHKTSVKVLLLPFQCPPPPLLLFLHSWALILLCHRFIILPVDNHRSASEVDTRMIIREQSWISQGRAILSQVKVWMLRRLRWRCNRSQAVTRASRLVEATNSSSLKFRIRVEVLELMNNLATSSADTKRSSNNLSKEEAAEPASLTTSSEAKRRNRNSSNPIEAEELTSRITSSVATKRSSSNHSKLEATITSEAPNISNNLNSSSKIPGSVDRVNLATSSEVKKRSSSRNNLNSKPNRQTMSGRQWKSTIHL